MNHGGTEDTEEETPRKAIQTGRKKEGRRENRRKTKARRKRNPPTVHDDFT
jgi:hypothetical protein